MVVIFIVYVVIIYVGDGHKLDGDGSWFSKLLWKSAHLEMEDERVGL